MRVNYSRLLISCAALGGLLVGCESTPAPVDAGRDAGMRDSGGDVDSGGGMVHSGPADSGTDAGADAGPGNPYLRLANMLVGTSGTPGEGIHVCLGEILATRDSTMSPFPVPYGGVSGYVNPLSIPPFNLPVRGYRADGTFNPASGCTSTTAPELFSVMVSGASIMGGDHYTVVAVGVVGGTGASAPGLRIIHDDIPDTGTSVRLLNFINGVPGGANVDLCYDPDGAAAVGGGAMPGTVVHMDVAFPASASPVAAVDIAYPELPASLTLPLVGPASLAFHVTGTACADATLLGVLPIPVPLPPDGGGVMIPPYVRQAATIEADEAITIFGFGRIGAAMVPRVPCDPAVTPTTCTGDMGTVPYCQASAASPTGGICLDRLNPSALPYRDDYAP